MAAVNEERPPPYPSGTFAPEPQKPGPVAPRTQASAAPVGLHDRVAALKPPGRTAAIDLIQLYNAIGQNLPGERHTIIQMVSATSAEGNVEMASNLAWVASSLLGKRVLFIDATRGQSKWLVIPSNMRSDKVLNDAALGTVPTKDVVGYDVGQTLFLTKLQQEAALHDGLATSRLQGLFDELRAMFDLVLIAPSPTLEDPVSAILSNFVDGSVLVARAGKSNAAKLEKCIAVLETLSAPVVGVVLQKRQARLARWFKRWGRRRFD